MQMINQAKEESGETFRNNYAMSEIVYFGYPNLPYTNVQLEQASDLILSHFQ